MRLREQRTDAVVELVLNRPRVMNALDEPLVRGLADALRRASEDRSVRAIVLSGAGGNFCSGADLKDARADADFDMAERLDLFQEITRAIVECPSPVVAAVDGAAVGFGADMALACDLRLLSRRAYLQEAFSSIGLMPDGGGTFLLPSAVGTARALEIMWLGKPLPAQLAQSWGLANSVHEPDELMAAAHSLAQSIAARPPLAIREIKRAVRDSIAPALNAALAREREGQVRLSKTRDSEEGVAAFTEKRRPVFRGE